MGKLSPILRSLEGGKVAFRCPGCGSTHAVRVTGNDPGPRWTYNGDPERPTFSPSILVTWGRLSKRCHSFVRAGEIEFLGDCTHELAGKTVPIPPFDEEDEA
jgi:hypothetical protein